MMSELYRLAQELIRANPIDREHGSEANLQFPTEPEFADFEELVADFTTRGARPA
jgi:hypothetical protein